MALPTYLEGGHQPLSPKVSGMVSNDRLAMPYALQRQSRIRIMQYRTVLLQLVGIPTDNNFLYPLHRCRANHMRFQPLDPSR